MMLLQTRGVIVASAVAVLAVGCGQQSSESAPVAFGTSLAALSSRPVDPARELVITDPSVIASPLETTFDPSHPSGMSRAGAWSFGRLVHNMLPAPDRESGLAASQFVLRWLKTWETAQQPNATVSPAKARASIRLLLTNRWKAASGCVSPEDPATDDACVLDFNQAPFKLMAIVYRPDLRVVSNDGTAIGGEGRFVFEAIGPTLGVSAGNVVVMDPAVKAQKFTVIFEYSLPVTQNVQTLHWANRWHELGGKPFGPAYNALLHTITNGFSGPDQDLRRPNGNALDQLRTNEVALAGARFPATGFTAAKQFWELREFHLTANGLEPHTMNLEPARDFDVLRTGNTGLEGTRSAELISYLLANADSVLAGKHKLADGMSANSALVGSSPYGAWGKLVNPNPPTIAATGVAHDLGSVAIPVRDSFALNTCAGCHRHETDTRHFMHISFVGAMEPLDKVDDRTRVGVQPGTPDDAVVLSNFLRGEIEPGGGRYEDFAALLATTPSDLHEKQGLKACDP